MKSILILLATLYCQAANLTAKNMTVGYWDVPRYGLQNTFMRKLLERVQTTKPNLKFNFRSFSNKTDLQACVDEKKCGVTLDYEGQLEATTA